MPHLNNYSFRQYFQNLPNHEDNTKYLSINLAEQRNESDSDWDLSDNEMLKEKIISCQPISCCQLFIVILLLVMFLPAGLLAARTLCSIQRVGIVFIITVVATG